ncbi:MAG: ribosome biogenesis factor YjgA [Porticoccaceae bacterium]
MADFLPPNTDDPADENRPPSKSELKREMQALQQLGKDLMALPDSHFARMPLSEEMRDAMALYKRLKHNEARRRQLQFIGKNMPREAVADIRAELEKIDHESKIYRHHFHRLEQLRDELIAGGNDAVTQFLDQYPTVDIQQLRNLVRQAQKEQSQQKPPAASRKLFRFLRENLAMAPDTEH